MREFEYARGASLQQIVAGLGANAAIIAGGTELLNWMRLGIADPPASSTSAGWMASTASPARAIT
jgi:CO/xanthine dehydrogenase FAD-binding subunit